MDGNDQPGRLEEVYTSPLLLGPVIYPCEILLRLHAWLQLLECRCV